MAVTAMAVLSVSASAEVSTVKSGKTYSTMLTNYGSEQSYKLVASKSGTLKITLSSQIEELRVIVSDTSNNILAPTKHSDTLGTSEWYDSWGSRYEIVKWNSVEKKYTGSLSFSVKKGTYYIKFVTYKKGEQNIRFIPTFPSKDSSDSGSDVKINNLTLTMKVSDTLQLGTALSASTDDNVAWKSSKTSVAKVSATGLVTAKAAGTATITASIGGSTQKIDIIVKK